MSVKKYVKVDSVKGYLDNKDDINYFATSQMRKIAFGKMLGDFDENGLYVIKDKIIEELIKMPKVIVEVLEDADLIRSKVRADSFFHFILTIEDNKACFKLLEKIHYQSNRDFDSGVYSNINEYIIDEVVVPDKDFDRNALYQKYNISTDNDGDVLSIFDMDELSLALYYNIVEKLKIDYLVQNELILKEKELENIEADYFESILKVFTEFKEFGDKVTISVKKDLAEKYNFVIISKPFFQKTVNEVLDSYIEFYIQDLSPEQKDQLLERIREIKASYYEKFKALIPIEIAKKAGVRFDSNKVMQESVFGELAQEFATKGFAGSDVRKILINEGELQLSINKIKEMVKENEEVCKRDNAKARDITKNRPLTSDFYNELQKEDKVDILKPDTTLIKSAIDEKVAEKKGKGNIASAGASASVGNSNKPKQQVNKSAKTAATKPQKPAVKKPAAKQSPTKATTTTNKNNNTEKSQLFIFNSVTAQKPNQSQNQNVEEKDGVLDDIVETEVVADRVRNAISKSADVEDGLSLR